MTDFVSTIADFGEDMCRTLLGAIEGLVESNHKPKVNNAKFIDASELLSTRNKGFCLSGRSNLSVKKSYENCLAIGGTGTGKSSVLLINSLLTMEGSMIINDPSGELLLKSSGGLKSRGYEIKVLNLAHPEFSAGYNPLPRSTKSTDDRKIARMITAGSLGENAKDPFWNLSAEGLQANLIGILRTQEKQYQTPYNLLMLVNMLASAPKAVEQLFREYASDDLWREFSAFQHQEDKVRLSIIATCRAALQIFSDPDGVGKLTAFDTLDLRELRQKKTAIFIQSSISDMKLFAPIISLFFEQCFAELLTDLPEEKDLDVFLMIDECASLKIPNLSLALVNLRKYRVGTMLLLQSYEQLVKNYSKSEAETIRSNCYAKIFFTNQGLESAKELEAIIGRTEISDSEGKKTVVSLMSSDNIRTMPKDRAILVAGSHRPALMKLYPYYENPTLRRLSALPPVIPTMQCPFEKIPLLPLETPDDEED